MKVAGMKKSKIVVKKSKRIERKAPLAYSLSDLLSYYPISEQVAFEAACVHRITWARWLKNEVSPPEPTVRLIRLLALGALPDNAFNDFTCHSGLLWDDTNTGYTPADIRSIPFFRTGHLRYVRALEQIDELKKTVSLLKADGAKQLLIK